MMFMVHQSPTLQMQAAPGTTERLGVGGCNGPSSRRCKPEMPLVDEMSPQTGAASAGSGFKTVLRPGAHI